MNEANIRLRATAKSAKASTRVSNQVIYERIFNAISERDLPPGTKLSEEKLAKIFGVSRTRIRELLTRLAYEKIVTLLPNRGAFVTRPSVQDVHDVFDARRASEPAVIRRLAQSANPAQIARLREHVAAERTARTAGNGRTLTKLSGDFHLLVGELAANPFLSDMVRGLVSLTRLIIYRYDSSTDLPACLHHEHDELVSTVERHDPEAAAEQMIKHLDHVESSLNLNVDDSGAIDLEKVLSLS